MIVPSASCEALLFQSVASPLRKRSIPCSKRGRNSAKVFMAPVCRRPPPGPPAAVGTAPTPWPVRGTLPPMHALLIAFATTVIINAQVADGTGAPLRRESVRITDDRISAIGNFEPARGDEVVDAKGLVLAP